MFDLNTRFQVAAMCCYVVLVIDYIRGKKVNLIASKWFNLMLVFTGLYLIFDVTTVYTVTYMQGSAINRICHQLFIGCLDSLIFSLSVYVEMIGHRFANMKKPAVALWAAPYVLSMIMVIFGELNYYNGERASYSYGPMAYTVYISVFFYVGFVVFRTFKYKDVIPYKKRTALRLGALIWVIFGIIQLIMSDLLISSLGVVLVILMLYFSFENPGENIDLATEVFNQKAFESVIAENLKYAPKMVIISLSLQNINVITNSLGKDTANRLMKKCCRYMTDLFHACCYRTKENTFTVVIEGKGKNCDYNEEDVDSKLKILESRISDPWVINKSRIKVSSVIDVIKCPDFAETAEELLDLMKYMYRSHSKTGRKLQAADEDIIREKQRYETVKKIVADALENDGFDVFTNPFTQQKSSNLFQQRLLFVLRILPQSALFHLKNLYLLPKKTEQFRN